MKVFICNITKTKNKKKIKNTGKSIADSGLDLLQISANIVMPNIVCSTQQSVVMVNPWYGTSFA